MGSTFRLALIQLGVGSNKSENLARAVARVGDAARYIYLQLVMWLKLAE